MAWANPGREQALMRAIRDFVGTNDSNNTQSTSSVTANNDGSLAERMEYVTDQLALYGAGGTPATFNPMFGYKVTKVEDVNTVTSDDLFTLTGKCAIMLWTFEVTNALAAGVSDYQITLTTLAGKIIAAGNIGSAIVGFMRTLNGSAASTALNTSTAAVSVAGVGDTATKWGPIVVGIAGGSDVIKSVRTAGDASDAIRHDLWYWPLEASASIVAAA